MWGGGGGGDQGTWAREMGQDCGMALSDDGLFSGQQGAVEHE